ncbi:MAG: DUF4175 family protein [Candidatus Dadabacteria bacterium]|nr:MAG: DUF4175 family protein [Candidatus Dadabacteria bacterium]
MTREREVLAWVGGVRRRSRRVAGVRAVAAFAAGAGLVVAASAVVLPLVPGPAGAGLAAVFGAAAAVTGLGAARLAWLLLPPAASSVAAAELLAALHPERRRDLEAAADLARWDAGEAERRGASAELVAAQVEAGAAAVEGVAPGAVVPWRWAARPMAWGALGLAAAGVLLGMGPPKAREAWARLVTGGEPEPVAVGNLTVEVFPPGYTGLAPRRIEGSDGTVEALRGARVVLSGQLSRPVEAGTWEGPGAQVALERTDGGFRVAWVVDRPGPYRLRFREGRKEVPTDFGARRIVVREDRPPAVDLVEPEGDLEVFRDQEIRVRFRASDDFRVEGAEVVLQGDTEVRIPVPLEPGPVAEGEARILPLTLPDLGPGAHLRVEARDGDTVSGPKAGASRSVYVTFLDARSIRTAVENLEERLLDAVLEILADLLEGAGGEGVRGKAQDLLTLLGELGERVRQAAEAGTPGAVAALGIEAGLRAAVEPLAAGAPPGPGLVEELERDALFLDRLLRDLRLEEALGLGDELAALQRSLFDELQRGDADPRELAKRVEQIQDLLARMAEQLARSAREMPDAFANADAVRDMPRSELQEQLEALRDALARGDTERARELAAQVLETLSRWLGALEESARGAAQAEMDPLLAELGEAEEELGTLAAEQEQLLGETRDVGREVSARAWEEFAKERDAFLARQEERIRRVQQAAREMARSAPRGGFHGGAPPEGNPLELFERERAVSGAAEELRRALAEDWAAGRAALESLDEAVEGLREAVEARLADEDPARPRVGRLAETARENLEAIRAELEGLAGERLRAVTPEERERLAEMAGRQEALRGRATELAERLEGVGRQTPLLDPGAAEGVRAAGEKMGQARGRLGEGDPFGAVPPQVGALEDLAGAARRLREARNRMMQAMEGPGFSLLRRPGGRGGGRDVDRSPVEIPRESQAEELRAFREEVLRAMREGRPPPGYEREVEGYYERLIR